MLTDPRLMERHEWLMQIETMVADYAKTALTSPEQITPGMYLQSSQGYFRVDNVSLKRDRVTLERCQMNLQAMLERTGRYVPKKATVLNANYGWSVATAKPAPGGSWWEDEYAETVSLVVVTLVSCLVVMLIVNAIERFWI